MFLIQGSLKARNITGGRARGFSLRLVQSKFKITGCVTLRARNTA